MVVGVDGVSFVDVVELVARVLRLDQGRVLIQLQKIKGSIAREIHSIQAFVI